MEHHTALEPLDGISVIIPCYNEENAIAEVLDEVADALQDRGVEFEVIAVNDGSSDRTADRVDTHRFKLINHARNLGYGAALMTGVRWAKYQCIVITDADGTYPNARILDLFDELECHDMVVGARTGVKVHIPLIRRPAKWFLNRLANYLSGHKIPDINSGFRAFRKNLFQKYQRYYPKGFSLTTTITLAALINDHPVKYVPIDYHKRVGSSKIKPIRDTLNFISLIVRTVFYFEPLKFFMPLSILVLTSAFVVGIGTFVLEKVYGIGRFLDITTLLLFLTSIQLFGLGALADLINKRMQ